MQPEVGCHNVSLYPLVKGIDAIKQNCNEIVSMVKSRIHEIRVFVFINRSEIGHCRFQSDRIIITPDLAASILNEILR